MKVMFSVNALKIFMDIRNSMYNNDVVWETELQDQWTKGHTLEQLKYNYFVAHMMCLKNIAWKPHKFGTLTFNFHKCMHILKPL